MSDGSGESGNDVAPALLARAVDAAQVGATITEIGTPDPRFVYSNGAFEAMTGYDADAVVGEGFDLLFGDETADEAADAIRRAVARGDPATVEAEVARADGSTFVDELRLTPFARGADEYVLGLHVDVTEREEDRRALVEENERLDEFASIVSHDLKNPLEVASKRLDAYMAEHAPDHRLEQVERGIQRMEDLIDDLLALARHGTTLRTPVAVELDDLAQTAWGNVETADAELVVEDSRTMRGDRGSLIRLFENLFTNAVEHAGEDVTVTVGTDHEGFYVEDDGPGIPPVEQDAVFERGYSESGGTGFGLYIVNSIAEAHGWDADATDGEEGGARFVVRTRG